jgi:hypothetical protein
VPARLRRHHADLLAETSVPPYYFAMSRHRRLRQDEMKANPETATGQLADRRREFPETSASVPGF